MIAAAADAAADDELLLDDDVAGAAAAVAELEFEAVSAFGGEGVKDRERVPRWTHKASPIRL